MRIRSKSAFYMDILCTFSICTLMLFTSGCGKKLFPKPSGGEAAPQVRDFQAVAMPRAVELSWTVPSPEQTADLRYSIVRTELPWDSRNCMDCPGTSQHEVQSIDAATAAKMVSPADRRLKWADPNVVVRHAYRYQVAVSDASGTPISMSNPIVAKVYPSPAAPANVAAATQQQGVLIRWKPVNKDSEGHNVQGDLSFRVERMSDGKGWEKASPAPVKGNTFLDQLIASDQNYSYRVVPVLFIENSSILGEPSQVVLVKSPEMVLPPPPAKVWIVPAKGALEIRWTESDGKNGGYHVYRREGKEIIRMTANPVQHPPFIDQGAKKGATYFYAVSAVAGTADHKEGLLSKWTEVRNLLAE
ncbi:MAG: hypothetical protein LLG06_16820 [Desulfobacteraceae bacterium]|nr:hypothetical protein [Desulfobacteraceae bacterium]